MYFLCVNYVFRILISYLVHPIVRIVFSPKIFIISFDMKKHPFNRRLSYQKSRIFPRFQKMSEFFKINCYVEVVRLGFNAGNSRDGKFPGISSFPGNSIPGNRVRESREFRVCFLTEKWRFFFLVSRKIMFRSCRIINYALKKSNKAPPVRDIRLLVSL